MTRTDALRFAIAFQNSVAFRLRLRFSVLRFVHFAVLRLRFAFCAFHVLPAFCVLSTCYSLAFAFCVCVLHFDTFAVHPCVSMQNCWRCNSEPHRFRV